MRCSALQLVGLVISLLPPLCGQTGSARVERQAVVYSEPGRYGGWPANHGMWSWGDEIVAGFEIGHYKPSRDIHAVDYSRPEEHVLARSLDGGVTWKIERPDGLKPPANVRIAGIPTGDTGKKIQPFTGKMDFSKPGFAMSFRMEDIHIGPSRFYYSEDRGKSWQGPFAVPNFGFKGIAARTDYLINGPQDATVFLTAAKANGKEGRVICVRTRDGGQTWTLESTIGPEPEGPEYAIMPSSVRLSSKTILTSMRYRGYIDLWRSDDDGKSWQYVSRPAPDTGGGNPPSLVRLRDGRLVLTYGYRKPKFGIRARVSSDEGKSWGEEIILRDDAGHRDLGYTRTTQRADGKLVTVYYYNSGPETDRFIAATIWDPGQ
jgi:photosystem II stability/assembly factor-like uncharacterized protein